MPVGPEVTAEHQPQQDEQRRHQNQQTRTVPHGDLRYSQLVSVIAFGRRTKTFGKEPRTENTHARKGGSGPSIHFSDGSNGEGESFSARSLPDRCDTF